MGYLNENFVEENHSSLRWGVGKEVPRATNNLRPCGLIRGVAGGLRHEEVVDGVVSEQNLPEVCVNRKLTVAICDSDKALNFVEVLCHLLQTLADGLITLDYDSRNPSF